MGVKGFIVAIIATLATAACVFLGTIAYSNSKKENKAAKHRRETGDDSVKKKEPIPLLPENYHATGLLLLPHSGIAEPFEIWYAGSLQISRIDYYYGTDKTFQRGDVAPYGKMLKYVPMYSDLKGSYEGCWTVIGTEQRPVIAQTMIPNITWFTYDKTEVYTGTLTTRWNYEYWAYGMLNSQSVWVTKRKPNRPIRYEMKGYDSMMGSYYDHYVFEYVSFEEWTPDMAIFQLPRDIICHNWSVSMETSLMTNPMQEFAMFSPDRHINTDSMYDEFRESKHFISKPEHKKVKRKHIFKHNMRYIRSVNRQHSSFLLAPNHFADLSDEEYLEHTGSVNDIDTRDHKGLVELSSHHSQYVENPPDVPQIPKTLDWRDYGAVSPVKGQGICGSCYAFTAAGAAEGAMFLKTGRLVELSSQQIIDCSWGLGNHGCKGGHYAPALSWIYQHGIATDKSYGKYLAQEGECHFNDTLLGGRIDGFSYVQPWNNTALKVAITKHGPAAVSINVRPMSFKFYSEGVYDDAKCSANATRHTALVVGYGKENGKEFWLIKNSWSQLWGEVGYIKVAMEDNICGVTEYPVVALVNTRSFQLPVIEAIEFVNPSEPSSMGRKVAAKHRPTKETSPKVTESETPTSKSRSSDESLPTVPANEGKVSTAEDSSGQKPRKRRRKRKHKHKKYNINKKTKLRKTEQERSDEGSGVERTEGNTRILKKDDGSGKGINGDSILKDSEEKLRETVIKKLLKPYQKASAEVRTPEIANYMTPETKRWIALLRALNAEAAKRRKTKHSSFANASKKYNVSARKKRRRKKKRKRRRHRRKRKSKKRRRFHQEQRGAALVVQRQYVKQDKQITSDKRALPNVIANSVYGLRTADQQRPLADHEVTDIHRIMETSMNFLYDRIDKALSRKKVQSQNHAMNLTV